MSTPENENLMSGEESAQVLGGLTQTLEATTPQVQLPWDKRSLHIDEFLDATYEIASRPELEYPHFLFSFWRQPAAVKILHEPFMSQFKLFVDYDGKTWRVVGASRLGDVWLTQDFESTHYQRRVGLVVSTFANWRAQADRPLTWVERCALATKYYDLNFFTSEDQVAPKANRTTSPMAKAGVPVTYLECTMEHRAHLAFMEKLRRERQ
ncbi:hypothetical protein LUCX_215 [Xanthomonas phage vB_XciM_LucasX]|nr:hypothetical protein LUCX_215 [Xanthomonas phage vB_XciM_LucasX]